MLESWRDYTRHAQTCEPRLARRGWYEPRLAVGRAAAGELSCASTSMIETVRGPTPTTWKAALEAIGRGPDATLAHDRDRRLGWRGPR